MRAAFLHEHPMCAHCTTEPAAVLDHITPHRGVVALFWDQNNWQGLCLGCHGRKTAEELLADRGV
jgi:5-methylcytosine-specific restriction protein A